MEIDGDRQRIAESVDRRAPPKETAPKQHNTACTRSSAGVATGHGQVSGYGT